MRNQVSERVLLKCPFATRPSSWHLIFCPLIVLLLSLVAGVAADDKPQREEFKLRATVRAIVPLPSYSGTLMPIDGDPHFALTMKVEAVTPALTNFNKGDTVTFAIHSPTRTFGAADPAGKTYDFILSRQTTDGKVRYSSLEVRP